MRWVALRERQVGQESVGEEAGDLAGAGLVEVAVVVEECLAAVHRGQVHAGRAGLAAHGRQRLVVAVHGVAQGRY